MLADIGQGIGGVLVLLIIIFVVVVIYFFPTFIARSRKHHNTVSIFVLNLLLGWSVIGWAVALAWAFSNPPRVVEIDRQS